MTHIHGYNKLRPTRIGFLVRPADRDNVSRIMRWNTCLWGGRLNPIIPVGEFPPYWCEEHKHFRQPGRQISRDYMRFFEPDVLVEAEPGLAASIGYSALSEAHFHSQILSLDDLFSGDGQYRPEFHFGLSVRDAYDDIFQSQRQFILRDDPTALAFNETKLSPIAEVMFGAFPKEEHGQAFQQHYTDVFRPKIEDLTFEHWFKYSSANAMCPFIPTRHKVEISQRDTSTLSFFIFDHTKPGDLIDCWNRRLFGTPIYPVPLCWLTDIAPTIVDMVTRNHRPIPNNPSGIKFNSGVYFGRSLNDENMAELFREYMSGCPEGAVYTARMRHPKVTTSPHGPIEERHDVKADSTSFDFETTLGNEVRVETLAPDFAEQYRGDNHRWSNVINLRSYDDDAWALLYPSNLEDRSAPRRLGSYGERPVVTREGWVFGQKYAGRRETIKLSDGDSAISEWLEQSDIKAKLSGAGRIAKQMLKSLGGLWDTHLIANPEVIKLLNKMASQETILGAADDATRRQFEGRTVIASVWQTLIKRLGKNRLPRLGLDEFTKRGILKLGLGVSCPNCSHKNWYGLDNVDYDVVCERCLNSFKFPQGGTSARWKYRVTGPFSVPNFAEGSYAVALTLNVFNMKSGGDVAMTYTTGLDLTHKSFKREVDFAFWHSKQTYLHQHTEPRFVFGEAKSFAEEAITATDIESLKLIAQALPGSIIVVSVMKPKFSDKEKVLLTELTRWGWEHVNNLPRAQILLMSGVELFAEHSISDAWENAGDPYSREANYSTFVDLDEFAMATQKIHLGLNYYETLRGSAK